MSFRSLALCAALAALIYAIPALAAPPAGSPATPAAAPAPAAPAPAPADAEEYTGLLIDARHLPDILRSPAPCVYGPAPDSALLYPDRSHVPTPDEVQDESVVRYYHTVEDGQAGVGGSHPLILKAEAVVGYAKDSLQLNAADMARMQDLEKKIHFTQTWHVGFLIPADH